MLTRTADDLSDLPEAENDAHQIASHHPHVLSLTVQRIFHFLCDGQYFRISVEALVVPIASISEFSIRASFDCLIEVVNGVSCRLRFRMLDLEGGRVTI